MLHFFKRLLLVPSMLWIPHIVDSHRASVERENSPQPKNILVKRNADFRVLEVSFIEVGTHFNAQH
jgi:hypothetical protein